MSGRIHELLSRDHERLDRVLSLDEQDYAAFRSGLLRHIGIEERLLFPAIRAHHGDLLLLRQLHRDHAALSALLVPPPTAVEIDQIRSVLAAHNPLEENSGGLYDLVDQLSADAAAALTGAIEAFPVIPTAPHSDTPLLRTTIAQLLREAEEGRRRL